MEQQTSFYWATSQSALFALVIEYVSSIHPWANRRCWINQSERALCFSYVITCVVNCQPIKTRALLTWLYLHFTKWRAQVRPLLHLWPEEVHNGPAVRSVLSAVYRETKKKQKKLKNLWTNWVLSKPFYFSTAFCFFSSVFCFTVLRKCHCTKSAMLQITVCCDLMRVWCVRNEFANFLKFANASFPT